MNCAVSRPSRSGSDSPSGPGSSFGLSHGAKYPPIGVPTFQPPLLTSKPKSSGSAPVSPRCHLPAKKVR